MRTTLRILLLFLMFSTNLWASSEPTLWYTQTDDKKVLINVELFLSSTCPHCHQADSFFRDLEANTPWIHVQRYTVNEDKNALTRFYQLLTEQNMSDFAVPSVFFCNSRWVGFAEAKTTGKDLLHALNYCKQQIEEKGKLTKSTVNVLKRWAHANFFDAGMTENPTARQYILFVAFLDAFNPCALFCIAVFFAFLFIQKKSKDQLVSGALFILAVGLVHYFQQEYTNAFFELLPWLRLPAALVGIYALYLARNYYSYKKIPTNHVLYIGAFLFALMIQSYQQSCVMNWSYIFKQWLYNQTVSNEQKAFLQFAYQITYLVPLIITLALYCFWAGLKYQARFKSGLSTFGLLFIGAVALFLIIYPLALSSLSLSLWLLLVLIISGCFWNKFYKIRKNGDEN